MNAPMNVLIGCEESGALRDAFHAVGCNSWSCDTKSGRGQTLGNWYPDHYPPGHRLHDMRQHHQVDILELFSGRVAHCMALEGQGLRWDLMIAHPPCTFFSVSGAWAFKDGPYHQKVKPGTKTGANRRQAQREALEFVLALWNAPADRICIENPVGMLSTLWRKPDQIIQPYQFGDNASKATCLWLKNLPQLRPTSFFPPRWVCCGLEIPESVGKYGCPNCNGEDGPALPRWGNQTNSGQNNLSPSDDRAAERAVTYPGIARAMADQWGALNPAAVKAAS
jgi:hypothetical protein